MHQGILLHKSAASIWPLRQAASDHRSGHSQLRLYEAQMSPHPDNSQLISVPPTLGTICGPFLGPAATAEHSVHNHNHARQAPESWQHLAIHLLYARLDPNFVPSKLATYHDTVLHLCTLPIADRISDWLQLQLQFVKEFESMISNAQCPLPYRLITSRATVVSVLPSKFIKWRIFFHHHEFVAPGLVQL